MPKLKSIPDHLQGITRFDIQISEVEPVNQLFSKCFIKILYPGLNRNNVFIEKEVANEMAKTLINVPIVGEYIEHKDDFGSHGGRIEITDEGIDYIQTTKPWGFIPESSVIGWQDVVEADGTRREYLTAVGYLWTGRYPELTSVINSGRPQSMELHEDTLDGFWERKDGKEFFHITKADFSALCILGNDVPPAFESANIGNYYVSNPISFSKKFSRLLRDFEESQPDMIDKKVVNFSSSAKENQGEQKKEGGQNMKQLQFKIDFDEDNIKYRLYDKLHPTTEEDTTRQWQYSIVQVNDDNAIIVDETTNQFYKLAYTLENEDIILSDTKEEINFVEATEEDRTEIEALQAQYAQILADYETLKEDSNKTEDTKIVEFEQQITTLKEENEALKTFKLEIEQSEKNAVIAEFDKVLSEEEIEPFKTKLGEYSKSDLEKELAFLAFNKTKNITNSSLIPDGDSTNDSISGAEKIIRKWNKVQE